MYRNSDSEIIKNAYRENPFIEFENYVSRNDNKFHFYKLGYRDSDTEVILGYILLDTTNSKIYECNNKADSLVEWVPDYFPTEPSK
ncbi:MAG: hypothetical protein EOP56_17650 [Sphingobacteriales bacterium]|nr:MAG: hypothetical protein EOP56_17650 [Sphingobacteriales bacterium]